jgi:adenosine deaminase
MSKTDLSEIAANSVYQSGFDERIKTEWYGENHGRMAIDDEGILKRLKLRSSVPE